MMTHDIQNFIEETIKNLGFSITSIDFDVQESGGYVCRVISEDHRELIGKDGETLQSLNHLIKRFIEKNNPNNQETHFLLDVNDYQEKKIQKIKAIAHMMAERARFFKSAVELDPMNAFERHIIHEYIQNQDDLETESTGIGKERRVVIRCKK
jgi:spoIIIJ-associated protein